MSGEQPPEMNMPDDRDTSPSRVLLPVSLRRWRWWLLAAAVVLLAGGTVAVRSLAGERDELPAPEVLAQDPVPAERVFSKVPENCGVTAKTIGALTPDERANSNIRVGHCAWFPPLEDSDLAGRSLEVTLTRYDPPAAKKNSPVATAMGQYTSVVSAYKNVLKPVRGLGDEAVLHGSVPDAHKGRGVVFRTGNMLAEVRYYFGSTAEGSRKVALGRPFEAGVLRAAADVARGLGAPARPAVSPFTGPAPATPPKDACALVPKTLRDKFVGAEVDGDGESSKPTAGDSGPPLRTAGCTWTGDGRNLKITIATGTATEPGRALRDITREYLRSHYEARAEPPVSARDPHYFHALKGLGDQGFGAYVPREHTAAQGSWGPATVAVRIGGSLVTVEYESVAGAYDENEPLTMTEAVNGAYAAARPVVRALRH